MSTSILRKPQLILAVPRLTGLFQTMDCRRRAHLGPAQSWRRGKAVFVIVSGFGRDNFFPRHHISGTVRLVVDGLEVVIVLLLTLFSGVISWRAVREDARIRSVAFLVPIMGAALGFFAYRPRPIPLMHPARPRALAGEWSTAASCRSCHPEEHASWHRSYHRTMTQDATPENIVAPLNGPPLQLDGRAYRLERRGDEIWAALVDPDAIADAAMQGRLAEDALDVERRVVLATGSHHEQAYWVAGKRRGDLRLFPWIWHIADKRWIPRRDAFLQPPESIPNPMRWNSNCIACHAVAGKPGHDLERDVFATRVVDLGIACEACHGPGGEHVRQHRDPISRYLQRSRQKPDPTIVNPRRLSAEASASVCGQCHAYAYPKNEDEWWSQGYSASYRAGQSLEKSRTIVTSKNLEQTGNPGVEAAEESLFWSDGTIRVGGREYNALIESPCYQNGAGDRQMSCLSCHSMHAGKPDDQLDPQREGDKACVQCHEGKDKPTHTHHSVSSSGSSCLDCHMPFTTYALFKTIRSHRIDSPSIRGTLRSGRPNACNLCHLDKSLGWTGEKLEQWYGMAHVEIDEDHAGAPASVIDALRGDAAVRVVFAAALGREEALAISGRGWEAAVLAELLMDPYSAIRHVAAKSLRGMPAYSGINYDFLAPPSDRERARTQVLDVFARSGAANQGPSRELVKTLLAKRDDRAITIAE